MWVAYLQASGTGEHSKADAAPLLAAEAKVGGEGAAAEAVDVADVLKERSTFNPRKMRPKR